MTLSDPKIFGYPQRYTLRRAGDPLLHRQDGKIWRCLVDLPRLVIVQKKELPSIRLT